MAERMIVKIGDVALRKVCKPAQITEKTISLLEDMQEILKKNTNGAALAAPQVGILKRLVVINNDGEFIELINPQILEKSGEEDGFEGCLSIPGIWGRVKRAANVKVKALNRMGEEFTIVAKGFLARCLQHEIDHLDGILYIDHVAPGQLIDEITEQPLNVLDFIKISRENL